MLKDLYRKRTRFGTSQLVNYDKLKPLFRVEFSLNSRGFFARFKDFSAKLKDFSLNSRYRKINLPKSAEKRLTKTPVKEL